MMNNFNVVLNRMIFKGRGPIKNRKGFCSSLHANPWVIWVMSVVGSDLQEEDGQVSRTRVMSVLVEWWILIMTSKRKTGGPLRMR